MNGRKREYIDNLPLRALAVAALTISVLSICSSASVASEHDTQAGPQKEYNDPTGQDMQDRWDGIIHDTSVTLNNEPTNVSAFESRAAAYMCKGRFEEALKDYTRAIHLSPTNWMDFLNRGTIFRAQKEWLMARNDYIEALQLNSTNALAYKNLAAVYDSIGKFKEAIENWDKGLHLSPNDPQALIARGRGKQIIFDYQGAKQDFMAVIQLDPKNAIAYNDLAWLFATCPDAQIRNGVEAVRLATKACDLTLWKDWKKIDTLTAAYATGGDFSQAVEFQNRAIGVGQLTDTDRQIAFKHLTSYKRRRPLVKNDSNNSGF